MSRAHSLFAGFSPLWRKAWHFRLSIVIFAFLCLGPANAVTAGGKPVRRVLIINEVGSFWPGIRQINQGIRDALESSPYELEFYGEYMDTLLFPDPADQERIKESLIRKYQDHQPDVIVAVGPSPLKFMSEMHTKAFPGVPIVFSFPNWVPGSPSLDSDFTGVENDLAASETVEAALRLQPGIRHIVVVGGTSKTDTTIEAEVRKELKPYEARFDVSYLITLAMPDLLERLRHLAANSIVLISSLSQDAAGSSFIGPRAGALVSGAANAPVFSLHDAYIGNGEVGGKISSLSRQGTLAGELVLRILRGEKPRDIPRIRAGTEYVFDWRDLQRWGLKEKNLPAGSIVLNRQLSFWEQYKQYVLAGLLVLGLQMIAILALLWERARRRKTQAELRISEEKFSKSFRQGPLAITIVRAEDDRILDVNETFEEVMGWRRDEVIGRTPVEIGLWPDASQRSQFLKRVLGGGIVRNKEVRMRRKDGQIRTILKSAELLEVGGKACVLSVVADITERKAAEETLASFSGRLIEAQEAERTRIARELHDDISQRMAMIAVRLKTLKKGLPASEVKENRAIDQACTDISDLSTDIQQLSHRLHSSKLEYLGLEGASDAFCRELSEQEDVEIDYRADDVPRALPNEVSLCLFRVLQEALHNALKHSGERAFEVLLKGTPDGVQLTVHDSGVGFDPRNSVSGNGLGLTSMRERLKLVDGQLVIESRPQQGTTIIALVPLAAKVPLPYDGQVRDH